MSHIARRTAKAGTEQPVEVANIGKASLQCDIANTDIAQVLCGKEHERVFQQFGDVCREGCPFATYRLSLRHSAFWLSRQRISCA